jgi:ribose transport system ATP-binding protein
VNHILEDLGCRFDASDSIFHLSAGEMQMIAIAKALYRNVRIISFDEPTASLSGVETDKLFETINKLKANGITILFVSHKLDEVFRLTERATILRDGKLITTCNVADINRESLIRNMIGRDVSSYAVRKKQSCVQEDIILEVNSLQGNGFSNITFNLHKGEILGFSGLVGAKRTEVLRALFGADKKTGGFIKKDGKEIKIKSPQQALSHGIGLLPEYRKTQGFAGNLTNAENMGLAALKKLCHMEFLDKKAVKNNFFIFGEKVQLNTKDPDSMTVNLSGGNQQKVILAKWLATDSDILIFDEPTKGVDVGAKEEIYALMEEFVADGKSIIMISSEMPEIIGMSDRAIVMHEGSIQAEIAKENLNEEIILKYAMGD